jgi:hypothetical protein
MIRSHWSYSFYTLPSVTSAISVCACLLQVRQLLEHRIHYVLRAIRCRSMNTLKERRGSMAWLERSMVLTLSKLAVRSARSTPVKVSGSPFTVLSIRFVTAKTWEPSELRVCVHQGYPGEVFLPLVPTLRVFASNPVKEVCQRYADLLRESVLVVG